MHYSSRSARPTCGQTNLKMSVVTLPLLQLTIPQVHFRSMPLEENKFGLIGLPPTLMNCPMYLFAILLVPKLFICNPSCIFTISFVTCAYRKQPMRMRLLIGLRVLFFSTAMAVVIISPPPLSSLLLLKDQENQEKQEIFPTLGNIFLLQEI